MKKEDVIKKLGQIGLIPVVVFDKVEYAIPTAKALSAGGIDTMEITLRTEHGLPAIKKICEEMPEMIVGAGTVLTVEQAKLAVSAGAKYIVSPGFDEELVKWCVDNDILISPGCVTPTEIQRAIKMGINKVKFFPANVYGGIKACKSLNGPFTGIQFIPTGGVDLTNLSEYAKEKCVFAIGGGWLCNKKHMADGNFEKITEIAEKSVATYLNYEVVHVGVNTVGEKEAKEVTHEIGNMFNLPVKEGNSSAFAGTGFEIMYSKGFGTCGHVAIDTNNADAAEYQLRKKGVKFIESSRKTTNGKTDLIYLDGEFGGFALHLRQR